VAYATVDHLSIEGVTAEGLAPSGGSAIGAGILVPAESGGLILSDFEIRGAQVGTSLQALTEKTKLSRGHVTANRVGLSTNEEALEHLELNDVTYDGNDVDFDR